jgi:hypothetical protein
MGVRTDKGLALARYLTGSTGIPFMSWDGAHSRIAAPSPYVIDVTTSKKLENWHNLLRAIDGPNPVMAIRYDNGLPDVSHAWVGMKLMAFAPLLTAHYNSISDRIKGE